MALIACILTWLLFDLRHLNITNGNKLFWKQISNDIFLLLLGKICTQKLNKVKSELKLLFCWHFAGIWQSWPDLWRHDREGQGCCCPSSAPPLAHPTSPAVLPNKENLKNIYQVNTIISGQNTNQREWTLPYNFHLKWLFWNVYFFLKILQTILNNRF